MAITYQLSSSFVDLFKTVAQTPDDHLAKAKALSLLQPMKDLAKKGNPVAQFRLAQIYPKSSNSYWQWMQASAQQGFTNAMLALSHALLELGTVPSLQKAAKYLVQIFRSNDSFIKSEAEGLVAKNNLLKAEVSRLMAKTKTAIAKTGFFSTDILAENDEHHLPLLKSKLK